MFITYRCTLCSCMYTPTSFSKGRITSLLNSFKKLPSSHAARDNNITWLKSVTNYCPQKYHVTAAHSRCQRLHSYWSAPRITRSGKVQFSVHAQKNCSLFSAYQKLNKRRLIGRCLTQEQYTLFLARAQTRTAQSDIELTPTARSKLKTSLANKRLVFSMAAVIVILRGPTHFGQHQE